MEWNPLFEAADEKPLDRLVSDGGYCGIFRTIACVGDSLSSGEFEAFDETGKKQYIDMFDYSWGQFLGRMCGSKVYNFSKGGMTADRYCESFAEQQGFWSPDLAAQAYFIALGVNDLHNRPDLLSGKTPIGSAKDADLSDWRNNSKTFAGYYAAIIQRYREIQPKAKFFLVACPNEVWKQDQEMHERVNGELRDLLCDFAKIFPNTYVLDLFRYAPVYGAEFKKMFFNGGHMNPMGYAFTARVMASYVDWIIRKNPADFSEVGFIGTPYHYR